MAKATAIKTIKFKELKLLNDPEYATFTISGGIEHSTFKDFSKFLEDIINKNREIDEKEKNHKAKMVFDKKNDPKAKAEYLPPETKIKRINLNINSHGGYVSVMHNIVMLMESSPIPIDTYCFADAQSAGFYIFIHGKQRYLGRFAMPMVHSILAWNVGTVPAISRYTETLVAANRGVQDVIAKKTKIPKKFLSEKEDIDVFFTIEDCIKYKITDFIVED
jgi:ATP-dependent protease ClpP protease subunit